MADNVKVVKLLQNNLYPTYQLYAQMANKKTTPKDGLRLAALVTLQWLCQRLGEHVPEELAHVPEPENYRDITDSDLTSLHLNRGFVVDIVSMPEYDTWSLQITEPDLGSDPGNPEQRRKAVPGRIIETNVAFRVAGQALECGFKTVIADPEGVVEPAEVYRLAIIRRLLRNPDFGLKQVRQITENCTRISSAEQVKSLLSVWRDAGNQMPCVVFTQIAEAKTLPKPEDAFRTLSLGKLPGGGSYPPLAQAAPLPNTVVLSRTKDVKETYSDPDYDIERFAKSTAAYCRTYLMENEARVKFAQLSGIRCAAGDVIVLEPLAFGGESRTIAYKGNGTRRGETLDKLKEDCFAYPRGREMTFGGIAFLSAARESLLNRMDAVSRQIEGISEELARTVQTFRAESKEELKKKDEEYERLSDQLKRQREYQSRLEQEKDELREKHSVEIAKFNEELADRDATIAYLNRKISQPREHSAIAGWVEQNFGERLILHERAVSLLNEKSAQTVSVGLICDAIDFLATDYWERRYEQIGTEEMNSRCSVKYGRPFVVTPLGNATIQYTPDEYQVRYQKAGAGKEALCDLNYHLRVGRDPENLLRIYFFHDDERKKIVIGSLPKHLRAVSIK